MAFILMLALCGGATAAFQVTPQSRLLVDAFEAAAKAMRYGRKQIAGFLGLTEAQWKKQFDAEEGQHVSLYRVAGAPPDVIREWIKKIGPAYGMRVFDRNDDIVRLIDANRVLADAFYSQRLQLQTEPDRKRA